MQESSAVPPDAKNFLKNAVDSLAQDINAVEAHLLLNKGTPQSKGHTIDALLLRVVQLHCETRIC